MGRTSKTLGVALATAIGFATIATVAFGSAEIIKQRQQVMKDQGAAMKAINKVIESDGTVAEIAPHAAILAETSQKISTLFPEDSQQGDTKAKAEIWQDTADFDAKTKNLQEQSAMLVEAVNGGDMATVQAQFEKVGAACGDCHKRYRAKD